MRETKTTRKVDLSNLPKCKLGVDWKSCKGLFIPFEYGDMCGEIEILDYDSKTTLLTVKYKDNIKQMQRTHIRECAIGCLLGLIDYSYKYEIGDIVDVSNNNKLKILSQTRIKTNGGNQKAYKFECMSCGNIDTILESSIYCHSGCTSCSGQKSIYYSDKFLYGLLYNKKEGMIYSNGSHVKVDWVCPECGLIIHKKSINMVKHNGLSCPMCSPYVSYGEKFMISLLEQLNIYYEFQATFEWSGMYRYDVFLNDYNCIIEINGLYHYEDTLGYKYRISLEDQNKIDIYKLKLAKSNNIEEYIYIDARKSNIEHLKSNILESNLNKFFDITNVNFEKCNLDASKDVIYFACQLWNNGIHSLKEISDNIGCSYNIIKKLLISGTKSGICDFDEKTLLINRGKEISKIKSTPVICINTGEIFNSQIEAANKYNLNTTSHLSQCCKGKRKTCGINPLTNERLKWSYYKKEEI